MKSKAVIKDENSVDSTKKKSDGLLCASEPSCWENIPVWIAENAKRSVHTTPEIYREHILSILRRVLGDESRGVLPKCEAQITLKREYPDDMDDLDYQQGKSPKRNKFRSTSGDLEPRQVLMTQYIS